MMIEAWTAARGSDAEPHSLEFRKACGEYWKACGGGEVVTRRIGADTLQLR